MRTICGIVAVVATLALAAGLFAADDKKHTTHTTTAGTSHFVELEKCIKACVDCAKECESCFSHCTDMLAKGEKMHAPTVRTCNDCGELCWVAAKLMSRQGPYMVPACEACIKACDGCAKECDKHASHDQKMAKCAKACKDCAQACRDMVKAAGPHVTAK
jgi:hypothetical protein